MASCFHLEKGVHACALDSSIIILDMVRDRYLRLTPLQSSWYGEIAQCPDRNALSPEPSRFSTYLERSGLITRNAVTGKPMAPSRRPAPSRSLTDLYAEQSTRIDTLAVSRMAIAVWRCRRFRNSATRDAASAVDTASSWTSNVCARDPQPASALEHRVRQFHQLVPYFMTTHNACFFSSMVLMRFLLSFSIRADWVFGVRLSPFDAHCWISHGNLLLNETRDKAAEYTEIMRL
ncbi:MAG: lasso peptide biosynthesis B2 protein [Henriciella sp.]|uniref:lasso peptide biosynthesis B2 protein n=1 Tax=Henriciella sp. TaxID=1968823 RepID=UPI003C792EE2